jgi:parvulin-like peptidyl-prolyl isomerase
MRQIRLLLILPVLGVALLVAGCGGGGGGSLSGGDVAKVGNIAITQSQFDTLMARAKKTYAQRKQAWPAKGTTQYLQLQSQAVQFLVQRAEYSQEAGKLGVTISQKQIDDRLAQIKKQYFGGSQTRYQQQLKTQGITEDQVKSDIKDQLIAQALYDKVTKDVKVTPKEVTDYYNKHKTQYHTAESRTVRHILIAVCGKTVPGGSKCYSQAKGKALADSLYKQLKSGGNFAALAKKYSGDPGSANQGGKLTITKGQTVPQFDKVAFGLKVNQLSKPVKTTYGYHIIQALTPVKPAATTPLSQVRSSITQLLLQQKKQAAMAAWVAKEQKTFHVTYKSGFAPASTSSTTASTSTTAPATTSAG